MFDRRVGQHFGVVVDGRARHAGLAEALQPGMGVVFGEDGLQDVAQGDLVFGAVGGIGKARVGVEVVALDDLADRFP
ncbi:hypothetical protein QR52_02670 [Bordetella pertussis]|nr:hypothetical protein UN82_02535 [Bordetella pertussis]ALX26263.1 hypothetical protein RD18_16860 [Bordetella pertussis]AMS50259.1 hypothetical protein RD08_02535 [Bordetella pertussis]AMS53897.1 hypothetical protein RD09_02665 [Bordetella pertussis]AMS59935.1 hypothetical protein RD11_16885 [Bordetella pertussis]